MRAASRSTARVSLSATADRTGAAATSTSRAGSRGSDRLPLVGSWARAASRFRNDTMTRTTTPKPNRHKTVRRKRRTTITAPVCGQPLVVNTTLANPDPARLADFASYVVSVAMELWGEQAPATPVRPRRMGAIPAHGAGGAPANWAYP